MSQITWTEQQQAAIQGRNGSLIVSAAAGSGKTAVLVQRVLEWITDPKDPCGIDELLVVTFTNAAAAEMRSKISDELHRRLAEHPEDNGLRRQLALLGSSRIQTVHSFCQSLLREHFSLCGVDPDFRLADETQCALMKEQALSAALEQAYAKSAADFRTLCESLTEGRSDEKLGEAVLALYERLRSHPAPERMLALLPELCTAGPEESGWGRYLQASAASRLEYELSALERICMEAEAVPEVWEKYGATLEQYRAFGLRLRESIQQGWDAACACLETFDKGRLQGCRYEDKAFVARIKAGKDRFAALVPQLKKEIYFSDVCRTLAEGRESRPMAEALCRLTQQFTEQYQALKTQKNLLDFSDLEHLALQLLQAEDGGPSPLASELRLGIRELLVDEYQDTNEIQERIFNALRQAGDNAFFVGDVKQSIYGFRLADPDIFLDRYLSSEPYEKTGSGRQRLALNQNFRSRQEVLELCNYCFSRLMTREFGGVDYDEEQQLRCTDQPGCQPSEVLLLDCGERSGEEEERRSILEARLTARRVKRLLAEETVTEKDGTVREARPEDVAILLSSFSNKAPIFQKALLQEKLPCGGSGGAFFGTVEVSVMLSLLRLIWNRRQDIPLISVLRSPLYLASPDLLARLRLAAGEGDLIDGLNALAVSEPLCARLLLDLERYTESARERPLSALLRQIYSLTGAESVFGALDQGQARVRNLNRLLELARPFDGVSGGLGAFLQWMDQKLAEDKDLDPPEGERTGVQLMSIHRSKGLEYPFVIVPDLSKQFNQEDLRKPVMFHPDLGLGFRLRRAAEHAEYRTQLRQAIVIYTRAELRSEELRKLYVAMTRARQKLILVMSGGKLTELVQKIARESGGTPAPAWLAAQDNAMNWLLAVLLTHPSGGALRALCPESFPLGKDGTAERLICQIYRPEQLEEIRPEAGAGLHRYSPEEDAAQGPEPEMLDALAAQSMEHYAHLAAAVLPSKLTPTGLKRLIPETGEIFGAPERPMARDHHPSSLRRPDPSAAARGTAMHRLLCRAELRECRTAEGVLRQAALLRQKGFLTEEQERLLMPEPVAVFARSELAKRLEKAKRVLREYEFSVLLDADTLLENGPAGEQILLNGAMDLIFFEERGLTIVDFKTDRVVPGQEVLSAKEHALQLSLYQKAAEAVFGRPVAEKWLWFLRTGKGILLE